MARGQHRIYLGAAPGVGKTYAMLQEAQRRRERGADVVVAVIETHGRVNTAAQLADIEVVPMRVVEHRGTTIAEMDVDAVIARRPKVALVDELAHTNAPGSRNAKRHQDVEELLAAGIDVISTLNIQHLASLNDVVEQITGIRQQEVIPDAVVRAADQVQLVDSTPEALRRRMAHGNIYPAERVDAALSNYFREGNLSALRELALMWVADRVEEAVQHYREIHDIDTQWETRERVVVALTGAPGGDALIRRAARIAAHARGDLFGVHVRSIDGLSGGSDERLTAHRYLLVSLGGEYHEVASGDVPRALVAQARALNATQIVLGASQRSRWQELTHGSVIGDVVRHSGTIDVHVISQADVRSGAVGEGDEEAAQRRSGTRSRGRMTPRPGSRMASWRSDLPLRRRLAAWALSGLVPVLVCTTLSMTRETLTLPTQLLAFLLGVVVVAMIGGFPPAMLAAVISFGLENWYFTPPQYTLTIAETENLFSLVAFIVVAAAVGLLVSSAARRRVDAARARGEAETLTALAATAGADLDPLTAIAEQLRATFTSDGVAILRRAEGRWMPEVSSGDRAPTDPATASLVADLGSDHVVAMGRCRSEVDPELFGTFVRQLGQVIERNQLRATAVRVQQLSEADELRAALLAAVSHDLRTPLASIKAAASTLRQRDVEWPGDVRDEFLATIEEQTDRLTGLVTNLLDMSRVQAGVVDLAIRPVGAEEIVAAAVASVASLVDGRVEIRNEVSEDLPALLVDPALAERVIANLVSNALKWSPPGGLVRVSGAAAAAELVITVADTGPGIPRDRRDEVFAPFQRLGDGTVGGIGLGLAVARGLAELLGGELEIADTPGGGTTMVLRLPTVGPEGGHVPPGRSETDSPSSSSVAGGAPLREVTPGG